ncbi:hypothetical protein [Micromonospora sp. NPDC005087]|uniref:hypothetical protein n=1 Tax=Micromonospora sp. NPDC005087 TaxID=3364225 RepID=UPI0036770FC4
MGRAVAAQFRREKVIICVFDEGCMGMYNAIIDDELLNPLGIYKERLSHSALVAEMARVGDDEAQAVHDGLYAAGVTFHTGTEEATELTDAQLLSQFRMYIAALRISDDFGLDAVGIQYQQGLKDTVPAGDLAEGLLNNAERPPLLGRDGKREPYAGAPLPHFNEVDEGTAVDSLVTNHIRTAMGLDPATTLHDVPWRAESDGQPPMYFPLGGETLSGVSKPGEIVRSRVFIMAGALHVDLGRGTALELATDANHLNGAYVDGPDDADRSLLAKAATFEALRVMVHICGEVRLGRAEPSGGGVATTDAAAGPWPGS